MAYYVFSIVCLFALCVAWLTLRRNAYLEAEIARRDEMNAALLRQLYGGKDGRA